MFSVWIDRTLLSWESGMSSFWASPVSPPMCFPTFSHIPSQIPTFTLQFRAPRWSDAQEVSRMHLACHHLTCYGSLWRASNTRNKIYFWLFKQLRVSLWLWVRLWVKIVRAIYLRSQQLDLTHWTYHILHLTQSLGSLASSRLFITLLLINIVSVDACGATLLIYYLLSVESLICVQLLYNKV